MRPIDADETLKELTYNFTGKPLHGNMKITIGEVRRIVESMPTITPPNEPLTWEELKAETKINPVYSVKYGWIFPSTVKDEPYAQIWFFTSKGFAQTELFYHDTFYRRPPEGKEGTK